MSIDFVVAWNHVTEQAPAIWSKGSQLSPALLIIAVGVYFLRLKPTKKKAK